MFGFLRRKPRRSILSLMEYTRDYMVCLEFADPIDITLRGSDLNEALRSAIIADASFVFAKLLGCEKREQVIGRRMIDFVGGDVPQWFINFGNNVVHTDFKSDEQLVTVPRPDGGELFLRLHMQNVVEDGMLLCQWITARNVTKQIILERQASKHEKTRAIAADAANLHSFEANHRSMTVQVQPEGLDKTTGGPDTDGMEGWVRQIIREDMGQVIREFFRYQKGETKQLHVKFRMSGKHGGHRWIEVWGTVAERDEEGEALVTTGLYRDVTDEVELAAKMISTQKLESLGVLAGGIAHDFNNQLMSILALAELGQGNNSKADNAPILFARIEKAATHASDLCNQLLAYAGLGAVEHGPVFIRAFLEENIDLLQVSASKRVDLKFHVNTSVWVNADSSQLRQVFVNLVANASDACANKAGEVVIEVGIRFYAEEDLRDFTGNEISSGKFASLKVSDNGEGMSSDTQARMFDPFFTTKFIGRGLGMAVVMGVVRSHGGVIRVESDSLIGTSIEILLPLIEAPQVTADQQLIDDGLFRHGKVLIVDDEKDVREIISMMLDRLDTKSISVGSGHEAMLLLEKNHVQFSVVILDITMPEIDGITIAHEILDLYPELPIMLSSGYTDLSVPDDLKNKVSFLKKPFTLKNLRDVLSGATSKLDPNALAPGATKTL